MAVAPRRAADVTALLVAWRGGDPAALDRLIPLVYTGLRRVAHRDIGDDRPNHPIQTTALVHEAYLRLIDVTRVDWECRGLVVLDDALDEPEAVVHPGPVLSLPGFTRRSRASRDLT